jgi:hypothetical protein
MENEKLQSEKLAGDIVNLKTEDLKSVQDFWAKHNFGTRLSLITFMVSFMAIVIAGFFGVVTPDAVTNMVFYSAILAYMTVTLGVNGLKILLDGIAKIKLGEKNENI